MQNKRRALLKELENHETMMIGEGRRLYRRYDKRHMMFEFFKVMASWRRTLHHIHEVSNEKFKNSLRKHGNDFDKAK